MMAEAGGIGGESMGADEAALAIAARELGEAAGLARGWVREVAQ